MEEERLCEPRPDPREAAQRVVEGAVGLLDPRRHCADPLVAIELLHEPCQRLGLDLGVRVEEEHVWRAAGPPAGVAAMREAAVLLQGDRFDRQGAKQVDGVVAGCVVDGDHLHPVESGERLDRFGDRRRALVRHDDHVYPGHGGGA